MLLQQSAKTTFNGENDRNSSYQRSDSYFMALHNLFRIFLHEEVFFPELQKHSFAIIKLADKYDCISTVSRVVKLQLLEFHLAPEYLYWDIKNFPVEYLYIGEKTKSEIVAREASIHVIGRWKSLKDECKDLLSDKLYGSLVGSHDRLLTLKERANRLLTAFDNDQPSSYHLSGRAIFALASVRNRITYATIKWKDAANNGNDCDGIFYREVSRAAKEHNIDEEGYTKHYVPLQSKIDEILCDLPTILCHTEVRHPGIDGHRSWPSYLLCARLEHHEMPWLR